MIRATIIFILFIIYLLVTFPLSIIGLLLKPLFPSISRWIGKFIGGLAGTLFFFLSRANVSVTGLEHVRPYRKEAVLFVGNHKSYIDIPLLARYIPFPVAFVAKHVLKKVPFISQVMILLDCLFLDRQNVRQAMEIIKTGIAKLKRGESVLIFPEGTRSKDDIILPFKQGSLKLAEKAQVPIIPFALKGTEELFGAHGFQVKSSQVWLTFGKPIYLDQLSLEEQKKSAQYVYTIVQEMYDQMHY